MPTTITCRIGAMSAQLTQPTMPLRLAGQLIEQFFAVGSANDITLNVVDVGAVAKKAGPVQTPDLHRALRKVVQNPTNATKVARIGIVFAHSFAPRPKAFGFMFDRGFKFDKNMFGRVPREGCAVFVGAIENERPATFAEDAAFTAVHELGHVFNLFHVSSPANIMASDPTLTAAAATGFIDAHRKLLQLCSTRNEIHPGGTQFGDLGTLAVGGGDPFRDPAPLPTPPLRLSIAIERAEFWHFEPIELDIALSVRRGVTSAVDVPDVIDPGYENFRVWIEEPSGERRIYQSPKFFCRPTGTIRVAPGMPFRRDISIFGQAGDYTFTRAGEHRIRAELAIPGLGRLRSNDVAVNVLPTTVRDRFLERARPVLERPPAARLLFYRDGARRSAAFRELEELAMSMRSRPVAAGIHYALGRALLRNAARPPASATLHVAARHLARAADHPDLSPHRREIAEKLIAELLVP